MWILIVLLLLLIRFKISVKSYKPFIQLNFYLLNAFYIQDTSCIGLKKSFWHKIVSDLVEKISNDNS